MAAGLIPAVKSAENFLLILFGNGIARIGNRQQALTTAVLLQTNMDNTGSRIFQGIFQQNIQHLGKILFIAKDCNIRLHLVFQGHILFIEGRFKGQNTLIDQLAEIQLGKILFHLAVIHPRKLQHTLRQPPHPLGGNGNIIGVLGAVLRGNVRGLQ